MFADFPLFLAPMAGVTNTIFRRICKARGANVLTTEFVSAEGILHRNARTRSVPWGFSYSGLTRSTLLKPPAPSSNGCSPIFWISILDVL